MVRDIKASNFVKHRHGENTVRVYAVAPSKRTGLWKEASPNGFLREPSSSYCCTVPVRFVGGCGAVVVAVPP
jgi:hypothetical protein